MSTERFTVDSEQGFTGAFLATREKATQRAQELVAESFPRGLTGTFMVWDENDKRVGQWSVLTHA